MCICLGNGWLTVDPYLNYKPKQKGCTQRSVDERRTGPAKQKEIQCGTVMRGQGYVCVCYYTGLAYVDVHKLKRSELVKGVDGNL